MIKELKLGNLLKRGDDVCIVTSLFLSHFNCRDILTDIEYGNNHQNNYQPIELNHEWFTKMGSKFNQNLIEVDNIIVQTEPFYQLNTLTFYKVLGPPSMYQLNINDRFLLPTFEYVHQIQNLYSSLYHEHIKLNL